MKKNTWIICLIGNLASGRDTASGFILDWFKDNTSLMPIYVQHTDVLSVNAALKREVVLIVNPRHFDADKLLRFAKNMTNFQFINIRANQYLRLRRFNKQRSERRQTTVSMQYFLNESFQRSGAVDISIFKKADMSLRSISNEDGVKNMYEKLDGHLKKICKAGGIYKPQQKIFISPIN